MYRLQAWLAHFGVSYHHIHASGHIYGPQLKQAIARINPKKLVPIHTEKPGLFSDVLPDGRVKIVKNGESLQV